MILAVVNAISFIQLRKKSEKKKNSGLRFEICCRAKAHLVFVWYVYNKMFYLSQVLENRFYQ